MSSFPTFARRAFAIVAVFACTVVSVPSSAAVTLLGTIATQTHVPAKLASCNVSVDGGGFSPTISFTPQPNPVARYTVTLAFFDKKNVSVGRVDVTDHGSDAYDLPAHADSMSCAISRLTLDDGSVYPSTSAGNASLGGIVLGVIGVGAIAGIAIGASHRSSNSSASATAAPSPTASATAASSSAASPTPTPSATAVGASAAPSATPTVAATTYPATPSPFPTATTTAVPSLRPQIRPRNARAGFVEF